MESLQRSQRLPKGLRGLWFRITGRYQNIWKQNERETEKSRIRDRDEKQNLIDRHLKERPKVQRQKQDLNQDIAEYMELCGPGKKTLQEEFVHVQNDRDIDHTLEMQLKKY